MAKIKLLKYPKKPKQSASLQTMERYLERRKQIDSENARRKTLSKRREDLKKKIAALSSSVANYR